MIEAIKEIGELLIKKDPKNIFPILNEKLKKGEEYRLVKIIFDLDRNEVEVDSDYEANEKVEKEYLWVGNSRGNKPQLVLSTDNLEYLLNIEKGHKWAIGSILDFIENNALLMNDEEVNSFYEKLKKIKLTFFKVDKSYKKIMNKVESELKKKVVVKKVRFLYIPLLKERNQTLDLIKTQGYQRFLDTILYENEEKRYSVCQICGKEEEILLNPDYPEGSFLKIYNVDKAGFLQGVGKDEYSKIGAHVICSDCKRKLLAGLRYVENKLRISTGLGKLAVFIIPRIYGEGIEYNLLETLKREIDYIFNPPRVLEEIGKVEEVFENFQIYKGHPLVYSINLLFGYSEQSSFRYNRLIQNIPVTRIFEIRNKMVELSASFSDLFEGKGILSLNLAGMFPLRRTSEGKVEWKPLIELYDAIFTSKPYPKEEIIKRALLFARINRYGTYELYGMQSIPQSKRDAELCRGILKFNILLLLLSRLGVIDLETPSRKSSDEFEEYLKVQNYQEYEKALFLLGVLVGKIGIEQYKKDDKKKSILNKIDFDGMSAEKVKILTNHIVEALRNYRILSENEKLYANMKELLDRNLEKLSKPVDNTFYLLSGYAYITLRAIAHGGEQGNESRNSE